MDPCDQIAEQLGFQSWTSVVEEIEAGAVYMVDLPSFENQAASSLMHSAFKRDAIAVLRDRRGMILIGKTKKLAGRIELVLQPSQGRASLH